MNLIIGATEKTIKRVGIGLGLLIAIDIVTRIIGWYR